MNLLALLVSAGLMIRALIRHLFEAKFAAATIPRGAEVDTRKNWWKTIIHATGPWSLQADWRRGFLIKECSLLGSKKSSLIRRIGTSPLLQTGSEEEIVQAVLGAAGKSYRTLWDDLEPPEKLMLRRLAQEDVVNPRDFWIVNQLVEKRLVVLRPNPQVATLSFARFVVQQPHSDNESELEIKETNSWIPTVSTVAVIAGIVALLVGMDMGALLSAAGAIVQLAEKAPKMLAVVQLGSGGASLGSRG